jgi:hypothetical protein
MPATQSIMGTRSRVSSMIRFGKNVKLRRLDFFWGMNGGGNSTTNYPYYVKFGALTVVDIRIILDFSPMIDIYQLQNFNGIILTPTT